MADLESAILYATAAHRGQTGRDEQPYILHPLRMMLRFTSDAEQTVAVLHDIVEKTVTSLDDLRRAGFAAGIIEAVDALTRREGESYEDLIERAAANPLARAVKIADLEDHLDLRHAGEIKEDDLERMRRQHRAWRRLTQT